MALDLATIITAVLGAGGLVLGLYNGLTMAKKEEVAKRKTEIEMLTIVLDEIQERNESLLKRVNSLEVQLELWQRYAARLRLQVIDCGLIPIKMESDSND